METYEASEELMRLALEATSDGLWEWDVATGEAYFSPRYYRMLGYEPGEFEADFSVWESLVHPDDLERAKQTVFSHLEEGRPYDVEFRMRHKSGRWHWILGRGRIVERDEHGDPVRMVGTHVDIHERKQATEELKRHAEELETLHDLSTSLALATSLDQAVGSSLDGVMRALGPDLALIYVLEGDNLALQGIRRVKETDASLFMEHHRIGECLCGTAAQEVEPVFSIDIHTDSRCTHPECRDFGIESYASLPIRSGEEVLGVLAVGSFTKRDFADTASLLRSVAALVSSAMQNALLHQEQIEHARELEETVHERTRELQEREARFRSLFEENHMAMLLIDPGDGTIVDANPAAADFYGWSRSELTRMYIADINTLSGEEIEAEMRRALQAEKRHFDFRHRLSHGDIRDVEVYSGPIRVHEKHLLYSTVIDVTKRRSTERALRRSESRYRTIFEHSRDGILVADTDTMRFTYANEAVCRLFGYSREELLGLGVPDIHPAEELDYVLSQFELQKRGELKYSVELPCVRKSGDFFYCDVSAVPVELEEAPSLMGFFRDVTERKQAQQLRDDVDRMFQHDLRNPLNGIINYPQLLRDDENLTGRQRELLGEIENAGRNMLRMLNLSLDIFKMETGSFSYSPVQTDILAVIRQIIGHYRSQIEAKHLVCSLVVNGAEPAENERFDLLTDENLFYSLVSNLLSNAVDASPNGEELKIELHEGPPHHLGIANVGAVPAEIRSEFFDKYKTTGKEKGTGLGTYSAKLIAENMGWDLRMESSDEQNTTRLTLLIPAH